MGFSVGDKVMHPKFGAGQITGPAVAGFLADRTGTFSLPFWLCAVLTALAVALTYCLRPPSKA